MDILQTFLILISALLLFLVVILTVMCALLFSIVCSRKSRVVSYFLSEGEKKLMEDFGDKIEKGRKLYENRKKEEVSITSFDSLKLHGYYIEGDCHDRTIICVHGYHGSPTHDFGAAVEKLLENGDLLLIDQRSHGKSEGKYITLGVKESQDCKAWAQWLCEKKGENHPVYLDGVSMGATTVLLASSLDLPKNVLGIIADCSYTSPKEILEDITAKVLKTNTGFLIVGVDVFCKLFAGFSLNEMSTKNAMEKNTRPILFAHGMKDNLVPYEMSKQAFDACKTQKHIILSKEADHGTSYMVDFKEYDAAIKNLFLSCEKNI